MLNAELTLGWDRIECSLNSRGVCQRDFLFGRSRGRGGWVCTESSLSSPLVPFMKKLD